MSTTGSASIPADRFVALVGLLNREVRLLERLVFKLTETELLTSAGEARFMGLILDEVDDVSTDLGGIEVARAMLVADLANALGVDEAISLQELIAYAPDDTAPLLDEIRERMIAASADLEQVAAGGTETSRSQIARVADALERLQPGITAASAYDEFGGRPSAKPVPTTFDQPA